MAELVAAIEETQDQLEEIQDQIEEIGTQCVEEEKPAKVSKLRAMLNQLLEQQNRLETKLNSLESQLQTLPQNRPPNSEPLSPSLSTVQTSEPRPLVPGLPANVEEDRPVPHQKTKQVPRKFRLL